jgi:hypothetical protein
MQLPAHARRQAKGEGAEGAAVPRSGRRLTPAQGSCAVWLQDDLNLFERHSCTPGSWIYSDH